MMTMMKKKMTMMIMMVVVVVMILKYPFVAFMLLDLEICWSNCQLRDHHTC